MRQTAVRWIPIVALVVGLVALAPFAPAEPAGGISPKRVLFIGNSYTYVNNLPAVLAKLAEGDTGPKIETKMVVHGGWTLSQLWDAGEALKALHEGTWDFVVLQEQSDLGVPVYINGIPRITTDAAFKGSAMKWAAEVQKAGAMPVFYLTWAKKAAPEDQPSFNYAYAAAARNAHGLVAPVGVAWAEVRKNRPGLELFFNDGSHPSAAGTYLAACVFYATILGQSPVGLSASTYASKPGATGKADSMHPDLIQLPPDEAAYLQSAAWDSWKSVRANGGYPDGVPPRIPPLPPEAVGSPISASGLPGVWSGELRLFPAPYLPVDMVLTLKQGDGVMRGHLDLRFHSKATPDASFELENLVVEPSDLTFAVSVDLTKNARDLKVRFRGVVDGKGNLSGNAYSDFQPGSAYGTWTLVRQP